VAIVIPVIAVGVSYLLLYKIARNGEFVLSDEAIARFFDFYYPTVTSIGLSLIAVIFVLSRGFLGGMYKKVIYLLFVGLLFQYFGDFYYTLANNNGTYFNGYWPDVLYILGLSCISLAIVNIAPERKK
jgi:hypothetical protein